MNILALDTSTDACSAALYAAGEVREYFEIAPRGHAALILPMLDRLLAEAGLALQQLNAVAFGRGPGSFTGVRIAASVAQGIAFGADLPVLPISSLAALAHGVCRIKGKRRVLAALDARMSEVYWGAYHMDNGGALVLCDAEGVYPPAAVPLPPNGGWFGAGSAWGAYANTLQQRLAGFVEDYDADHHPHARDIAALAAVAYKNGQALNAEQALPVYLRNEVAWKKISFK